MKFIAEIPSDTTRKFEIKSNTLTKIATEEQQPVWYFYVYDVKSGRYTHDYMQMTLEKTKSFAFKHFNIATDAWKQVE